MEPLPAGGGHITVRLEQVGLVFDGRSIFEDTTLSLSRTRIESSSRHLGRCEADDGKVLA